MKGVLRYYEPDAETNYPGGWAVNDESSKIRTTFKLSEDSMNWIEKNNPPKVSDVEFIVRPNCYFCEDTKTGHHELVADLIN